MTERMPREDWDDWHAWHRLKAMERQIKDDARDGVGLSVSSKNPRVQQFIMDTWMANQPKKR
jgi:hypothetical protein